MCDDLTAFFSKKANKKDKKKKAGIISIEDVGNRLERKARRNEIAMEEFEDEEDPELVKLTKTSVESVNVKDNEDSEWMDYNNINNISIPGLQLNDYNEQESEDEVTKVAREPQKSWTNKGGAKVNGGEKTEVTDENKKVRPSPEKVQKYIPKGQLEAEGRKAGNTVDLNNEEAFPSLGNADRIEKILAERKKEEDEEEKKRREEERKREREMEEAQKNKYQPKRGGMFADSPQRGGGGYQQSRPPRETQQLKEEPKGIDEDWRGNMKTREPPKASPKRTPQTESGPTAVANDVDSSWRRPAPVSDRPAPAPVQDESRPWKPSSGAYVPPAMRKQ